MPTPRYPLLTPRYPHLTIGLRSYFYSGWAFLIPYLAVYLLYYVTKWPVNAAANAAAGEGLGAMGNGSIASTTHNLSPIASHLGSIPFPFLLHVYWALHVIHAVLAGFALWSWWVKAKDEGQKAIGTISTESKTAFSSSGLRSITLRLLPWILLSLLFYIPGVYLEWPSDPWEHLRRINEWRILDTVGAHSSWHKSAYFIPYSLLSWCIGLRQLFWLDFYYTGICLLLCWQYYRFSRACGLGERSSMVFVIIQALLFGNNIFSFYRYYGISSSIYAQLGAVALTRIVLEWASWGRTNFHRRDAEIAESEVSHPFPLHPSPFSLQSRPSFWHLPSTLRLLPIALCLLPLIAFNHVQGIGIAGLGIAAIIVWRLIEWKRSALWWLIGGTIVINALFLWLYPRPAIIETYRAQGYLNAWYGFNIVNPASPAGDRMLQIVSAFGLVNLTAAFFLLRRNHVLSWLAVTPFLVLLLPCISIPFAAIAAGVTESYVVTFQRMLFASLPCLALTFMLGGKVHDRSPIILTVEAAIFSITAMLVLPGNRPYYNRIYHTLSSTPADLRMSQVYVTRQPALPPYAAQATITGSHSVSAVLEAYGCSHTLYAVRTIGYPTTSLISPVLDVISSTGRGAELLFIPTALDLYSPASVTGRLSTHWLPQEVAVDLAGDPELNALIMKTGAVRLTTTRGTLYKLPSSRSAAH